MTLIAAGAVVTPCGVHRPGWVETSAGRIIDVGAGVPPRAPDHDYADAIVVPGFVDIHVHGGGGASYTEPSADEIARAAAFHRRHGTTTTLASLVTAGPAELLTQVHALTAATRAGVIAGIHLEGPWLSAARCGAHDAGRLRDPDPAEIDALLDAADGTIRMVTVAPELPSGISAIRHLVAAGVVVAVGHTDGSYDQTRAALEAGATVGTHVFNAMRPLHHRDPGPAMALLEDPRATVELIADGVHVHDALLRHVVESAGPDRVALITDAMAAAGLPDGSFRLGALDVEVRDAIARVRGRSTIAGSTATMDRVFRAAVPNPASDTQLLAAAAMTATTPARAVGLSRVGSLAPGLAADLVMLGPDLDVVAVMADGELVVSLASAPGVAAP
ncbi:N-acetylglucosamine-6-phosphate deacetylase [Mycolicibacterium mucogenicum]|uniref:N-acetylglucosamine-6-phosphate deacetylase n=1 Tax=Mycolicibacterium mucogenicum TaxID=56689 RepID=A0A1A3GVP1_MYCMU|nr:N-acetylglucosamine-6-phosphate deacetylase [Mycolicibacterium mucogenicum]OBJ39895.1 N-acetylglucosamine-6-phosphate deacetylase [Mycolicibacterium mucogenicum]